LTGLTSPLSVADICEPGRLTAKRAKRATIPTNTREVTLLAFTFTAGVLVVMSDMVLPIV
jgi:hypothetical protein